MNNDTPRPIGRPKKIKPVEDEEVPHQLYFAPDMDFNDISKKIADDLGINQGQMSDKLAGAGLAYLSLGELKKNASLLGLMEKQSLAALALGTNTNRRLSDMLRWFFQLSVYHITNQCSSKLGTPQN
jgi:hypothetical protein